MIDFNQNSKKTGSCSSEETFPQNNDTGAAPFLFPKPAVLLAPMEDVTEAPFRWLCRRFGADVVYTEFTSSEAVARDIEAAHRKIMLWEDERPVGIQLFGSDPDVMAHAAHAALRYRPDLIDINCGCWTKTHALRGEGAGLLRDLSRFEAVVRSTVKAVPLPVTVKTRLGWDERSIVILDVAPMVEQAGAAALTVHCRTRAAGYRGRADWSWLVKIKQRVSLPVFGNGDVVEPQDAVRLLETGCDGVMIGRGAIGNPWIFKRIKALLFEGRLIPAPSLEERVDVCWHHFQKHIAYKGERSGVITFRKFYTGYFKGLPHAAGLREALMAAQRPEEVHDILRQYRHSPEMFVLNRIKAP